MTAEKVIKLLLLMQKFQKVFELQMKSDSSESGVLFDEGHCIFLHRLSCHRTLLSFRLKK